MMGIFGKLAALFMDSGRLRKRITELEEQMQLDEEKLLGTQKENEVLLRSIEEKNIKLKNFDLVSDALAAKPVENRFIAGFEGLINKEFIEFCSIEQGLNDTIPLLQLNAMLKEMQLIANCPALHSKSLGAVGGGFSSGKSTFLNSFLTGSSVRLAEGMRPVTAIPSYVLRDEKPKILGITYKGGCFDISLEMYKAISHEFLKSFSFNLKEIVLYTTVLAPMEPALFENLCLIDTPGYNPPSTGTAEQDFETAREYIKDARFLIWMVGLDSNGTIPKSDLDFLEKLDFGKSETPDRQLYIIANKAETKHQDAIEDILDVFEESLDDRDLSWAGISAYSSKTKKVYAFRKMPIHEFLTAHNKPSGRYEDLKGRLDEVFSLYITLIREDFHEKEERRKEVKRLLLDALESGHIDIDESSSALQDGLNRLVKYFQHDESLDTRLDRVKQLRDSFIDCFHGFCDEMGIERTETIFCTVCGERLKKNATFCTECGTKL
jgi:hypothetical protein